MGIRRILHPQWRDYNDPLSYPFADNMSLTNEDGIAIPQTTFIDASIYPVGGDTGLYLREVIIYTDSATFTIADDSSNSRCSGTMSLLDIPAAIRLTDAYGRAAGVLVSEPDRLAIFQAWSAGTYTFTAAQTAFAITCCLPTPEIGVRGILLADGTIMTGNVWLTGDNGIVLSCREVTTSDGPGGVPRTYPAIRIDVVGNPLYKRKLCADTFTTPQFLKSIKVTDGLNEVVCTPNELGDCKITSGSALTADPTLRVRTTANGIVFETAGKKS